MPHLKAISFCLVAIGLGWTFAEVRRFFFHTEAFCYEAIDDYHDGRAISLVCGVAFLFVGAFLAFHAFGIGAPIPWFSFPYVVAGPEARRFLLIFGSGFAVWVLLSAASTRVLPPPLFSEPVASVLCLIVRSALFLLLSFTLLISIRHIGDNWLPDGIGIVCVVLAFLALYTGQLWTKIYFGYWPVPPVTCADRPFPFVASVLICITLAYVFFLG